MVEVCEAWFTIMTLASSEHFSNFVFLCATLLYKLCIASQVCSYASVNDLGRHAVGVLLPSVLFTLPAMNRSLAALFPVATCYCACLQLQTFTLWVSQDLQLLLYFCVGRDGQNLYSLCTPVYDLFEIMCDQFVFSTQLQYAQLVSSGASKQYRNAQAALKEAEARLRKFLSRGPKVVEGEEDELSAWIVEEKTEDKDIAWLMGEEKKVHRGYTHCEYLHIMNTHTHTMYLRISLLDKTCTFVAVGSLPKCSGLR